jgi:hypothetical protein
VHGEALVQLETWVEMEELVELLVVRVVRAEPQDLVVKLMPEDLSDLRVLVLDLFII